MTWYRDKHLWVALVVGILLRVLPLAIWYDDSCVRDECTYVRLATRFAAGEGMTSSVGWLWAPGYPAIMGLFKALTGEAGAIKALQVVAAAAATVFIYLLAQRAFSRSPAPPGNAAAGRRAGRIAAWLYALSAHQIFFTGRLWSEVLYGAILMGGLLLFGQARDALSAHWRARGDDPPAAQRRALTAALGLGALVGVCVLFRGVAQYMLPIFVVGLLWGRLRRKRAWLQALVLVGATVLVVAPYSAYATHKFGGFVLSDKTMGRMMWLGNNDFPPITFDYGNGQLSRRAYRASAKRGRPDCGSKKDVMEFDRCQTEEAVAWIKEHPKEFVGRMPMRAAQMLNPHSLLTRHLRWGNFPGMPQWMDELIILWQAAGSGLVMLLGAVGLTSRGKGATGLVVGGILVYHVAAIALLAGLSRYRVPLEPLLMIYAAGLLASPRAARRALSDSFLGWRWLLTGLTLLVLLPLILWYLPSGWYSWRQW